METFYDYHIHTRCSFDSKESMVAYARAALQQGMGEICFTDHHELDYPCHSDYSLDLDLAQYFADLAEVRAEVPQLTIHAGVEAALLPDSLERIADDLQKWEFDFIIASQHVAGGKDPFYGNYYDDLDLRAGQRLYLEAILECIRQFELFDVVAHIGYVDRYLAKYPQFTNPKPFTWKDFPELLDEILNNVISRGKGIEVNTSNYKTHGYPMPHPSIIRRYAELGGEVITTGSDAHDASSLAYRFDDAYDLLRECGLKYVCTFEKHTPVFHKL